MNEKELADVLYNIKDIIKNTDEGPNTVVKHISELVEWALAQKDAEFPVPESELTEFLDKFGEKEFWSVCTGKLSGEFCYAEYTYTEYNDYDDDGHIFFVLKYGINDGDENSLYTDYFKISIYDFKNCKTFDEKYRAVQEA